MKIRETPFDIGSLLIDTGETRQEIQPAASVLYSVLVDMVNYQ